jgi:hypothetical protein
MRGGLSSYPIVPVLSVFSLPMALPDIRRAIDGQLNAAGLNNLLDQPLAKFIPPSISEIDVALDLCNFQYQSSKTSIKEKTAIDKARAGIRLLRSMYSNSNALFSNNALDVISIMGRPAIEKIISNKSPNSHFLPSDEQPEDWSGIPVHSVALFRMPLSIPIEILDLAQETSESSWRMELKKLECIYPLSAKMADTRPMKRITLREVFTVDLLTRYIGLYVRLGAPDFSALSFEKFLTEIEGDV